ncbi:hypothetical protein [Mycolicibacterium chubuense]|uniref:hypothetical protein n=1 Tax=Mycolicibacterium chubuense TaxID=1800 RepID=UPI001F1EACB8|nr:hypothetical protein [Mycolicibacterium chubuense]
MKVTVVGVSDPHQSVTDSVPFFGHTERGGDDEEDFAVAVDARQPFGIAQLALGDAGQGAPRNPFCLFVIGSQRQLEHGCRVVVVDEHEPARTDLYHTGGVERRVSVALVERRRLDLPVSETTRDRVERRREVGQRPTPC